MSIKPKLFRLCENPDCRKEFKKRKTTDKYCSQKCYNSSIQIDFKPTNKINKIPFRSKKTIVLNAKYLVDRIIFLSKPENKLCPITGTDATEIHHIRKRRGYADEWARLNNIPLLLDQRFWLAVSRDGHNKIENEPEWAYKMGYSIRNNQI